MTHGCFQPCCGSGKYIMDLLKYHFVLALFAVTNPNKCAMHLPELPQGWKHQPVTTKNSVFDVMNKNKCPGDITSTWVSCLPSTRV